MGHRHSPRALAESRKAPRAVFHEELRNGLPRYSAGDSPVPSSQCRRPLRTQRFLYRTAPGNRLGQGSHQLSSSSLYGFGLTESGILGFFAVRSRIIRLPITMATTSNIAIQNIPITSTSSQMHESPTRISPKRGRPKLPLPLGLRCQYSYSTTSTP